MKVVEIYSGLIWSVCYEGEKKDVFSRLFARWTDLEALSNEIIKNKRFLENNPFFVGLSVKDVILNANKEARDLIKEFNRLYWNERNGVHPDFDDRFYVLNKHYNGVDDFKRKMYGHPPDTQQMTSVLRLYAIKIPSLKKHEPSAYILTGGGIKLTDAMQQMKDLKREYNRIDSVLSWLKLNRITTKEQLIDYQNKYAKHENDGMGEAGSEN